MAKVLTLPSTAKPKPKYRNKPTVIDGRRFASKREAERYIVLKDAQAAGEISGLRCQVSYPLVVNGVKIGKYIADYVYMADGRLIVEDVKGMRTPVYRLKAKLMKAIYGITILET